MSGTQRVLTVLAEADRIAADGDLDAFRWWLGCQAEAGVPYEVLVPATPQHWQSVIFEPLTIAMTPRRSELEAHLTEVNA